MYVSNEHPHPFHVLGFPPAPPGTQAGDTSVLKHTAPLDTQYYSQTQKSENT